MDEGISATTTKKRDGFNQMIRDCKAGKIDLILTKSISRFARNTVDAIHYSRLLKNLDKPCFIFFEKENVNTKDENAELMVTLLGALAQQESRNIGSSIAWGKRAKASRGIVNVKRINYGYEFNEHKEWVIKEEEAAIVRRIYSEYLAGVKVMEIARNLNKDKVIPASGSGLWATSSINNILFNHIYNGDYVHNHKYKNPELKQPLVQNRGEIPMIHIENHHPAIIDRDMWESVQELRIHKQRIKKKIKQEFDDKDKRNESFDDKITCGECGNSFGFARYSNVRKERYWDKATGEWKQTRSTDSTSTSLIWRCNRARDGLARICGSKQFTQEYIELNFQHLLIDMITNNGFKKEYERVYAELELTEDELKIEASLRKEMDEHYQMLYEAVDEELNARGRDSKRIDSLTESLLHYQVQLKQYEEKKDRQSTLKNEVEWFMKSYNVSDFMISKAPDLQGIENTRLGKRILTSDIIDTGLIIEEATFNREVFERLIEAGRVYSDGRVVFNLKAGIEWEAPITYDNYERLVFKRIRIKSLMKYLDRINGPEGIDLLRYCKTPRSSREIHAFLDTNTLEEIMRTVINPLVEMGRLKYTIPEFINSHDQKYYSE